MRCPSVFNRRRGPLNVEMTPMIDVVFLLLVFFVWTASFQVAEQVLPSRLSRVTGAEQPAEQPPPEEADFADVVVRVRWSGERPGWQLNDQNLPGLAEVGNRLRLVHGVNASAAVVIDPDPDTPLEHVIDVYDVSRLAGFESVQFAVAE